MNEKPKIEVVGIDFLRLSAAALVMAYHFLFINRLGHASFHYNSLLPRSEADISFNFGWVGVELFFVISGYVIAYSAQERTAGSFLRGRVLRLVPGVWICATLDLLLLYSVESFKDYNLLLSWLRTVLLWPRDQINDVYWTLQIEIYFYVLVTAMIFGGIKRFIEPLLIVIGFLSGLFYVTELISTGQLHETLLNRGNGFVLRSLLLTHGSFFALGISLYRGFSSAFTKVRTVSISVMFICCVLEIYIHNQWLAAAVQTPLSPLPSLLIFIVGLSIMVLSIRYNEEVSSILKGPGLSITRIAGRATYPLYLVHKAVGLAIVSLFAPLVGIDSIPIAMIFAVVVSLLIERYPERWLRRQLARSNEVQRFPSGGSIRRRTS